MIIGGFPTDVSISELIPATRLTECGRESPGQWFMSLALPRSWRPSSWSLPGEMVRRAVGSRPAAKRLQFFPGWGSESWGLASSCCMSNSTCCSCADRRGGRRLLGFCTKCLFFLSLLLPFFRYVWWVDKASPLEHLICLDCLAFGGWQWSPPGCQRERSRSKGWWPPPRQPRREEEGAKCNTERVR